MQPTNIEWVRLVDHAKEKCDTLGVEHSLIWGRIKNGHGFTYRDREEGGYNMYLADKDLVVAFDVRYDHRYLSKTAVVRTVFELTNPFTRFSTDRFEQIEEN